MTRMDDVSAHKTETENQSTPAASLTRSSLREPCPERMPSLLAVASCFSRLGGGNSCPHSGQTEYAAWMTALQTGHSLVGASPSPEPGSLMRIASTGPCRSTLPPKSSTRQSDLPGASAARS